MQITSRDILLIWWINSCGAVTLLQIAMWLNVDLSTAARRIRKLIKAGLLRRLLVPFLVVKPVVATKDGCSLAHDLLPPLSGVRVGTWRHDHLLVDIEPNLERHLGGWLETERRIRERRKHENSEDVHLPDAIIHRPGGTLVAIEVELSAKAPARLQTIIDQYAASPEYAQVVYLTDDVKLARYIKRFTRNFDFISITLFRSPEQRAAGLATSRSK